MARQGTITRKTAALALWLAAVGAGLGSLAPVGAAPQEMGAAEGQFAGREERYQIQPGDVLSFQFRFTPEYNQKVKVQPDGYVSLSGIDDLKVGGMSVEQVRDAAVSACRHQLREPVVSVVLEEFTLPGFIVGGEVRTPGRYDLKGSVMLSEAIQIAGGIGAGAHAENVLLFRRASQGWMESRQINFKKIIESGLNEDIRLRAGDMVFIPRSKMGAVKRFMQAARVALLFAPLGLL
jgi:polysaccharide export outer membrane protein